MLLCASNSHQRWSGMPNLIYIQYCTSSYVMRNDPGCFVGLSVSLTRGGGDYASVCF